MVVTVQATGGVGTYITDPAGQASQLCGEWSGPTGLFGISCQRGSNQSRQSTFQFTKDHLLSAHLHFQIPSPSNESFSINYASDFLSAIAPEPYDGGKRPHLHLPVKSVAQSKSFCGQKCNLPQKSPNNPLLRQSHYRSRFRSKTGGLLRAVSLLESRTIQRLS